MHHNDILLGVNIDHAATLRQARGTMYPEPIYIAHNAEAGGADGITVHLREDRRHIQDRDVFLLKELIQTRLNLEMAVTEEMMNIAEKLKPAYCCFVPERREEITTEGGLDVLGQKDKIKAACYRLQDQGIEISLFIDPEEAQIDTAKACGAKIIEIHTGHFAALKEGEEQKNALQKILSAAEHAHQLGLQVNAGHGLNYQNVLAIAEIPFITELNIGHAIIAQALFVGIKEAVHAMKTLMGKARR